MRKAIFLVLVILAAMPPLVSAGGYYGGYQYGYAPYYQSYYPQSQYWNAGIYGGKWWPAGSYYWGNGYWVRQGYGPEYGIILPVAPLTTQILTLPAGLPQMTTLSPAPPAQTIKPPTPAGGGLSAEDIHDLKELLKELRKPQPPTAK